MPDISTRLLLDILLGIIVLLFVPFGIRRGGIREAMVSAGILLGALVAERWTIPAAVRLAETGWFDSSTASFVVALGCLLAGTFLLGYGGGAVAGYTRATFLSGLSGAVLAAINGVMFLAFLLQYINEYLRPGSTLTDGYVTGLLLTRFDLLLAAGAGFLLLWIIAAWIIGMIRGDRGEPLDPMVGSRNRPVRNASGADAGKYEPAPLMPTNSAAYNVTTPLPTAQAMGQAGDEAWRRPSPNNGHAGPPTAGGDWVYQPNAPGLPAANPYAPPTTAGGVWGATGAADTRRLTGAPIPGDGRRQCPSCGALAGPNDLYCPECGKTI